MAMTVLIIIAVACLIQRWIVATHSKWLTLSHFALVFRCSCSSPGSLALINWQNETTLSMESRQWMKENRSIDAKVQRKNREQRTVRTARVARNNKQTIFRRRRLVVDFVGNKWRKSNLEYKCCVRTKCGSIHAYECRSLIKDNIFEEKT